MVQAVPQFDRDPSTLARRPSTCVLAAALAAGTAKSIIVPPLANRVVFGSDQVFYANYTGTAVVPVDTAVAAVPAAEAIAPGSPEESRSRQVVPGSTISVITNATTCLVTASFFTN